MTSWNSEGKYIGRTDLPITENGKNDVIKLWHGKSIDFHKLYVSPMIRCIETAKTIFADRDFTILDNFKERDFGIFEGKKYEELKDTQDYITFANNPNIAEIKDGESGIDFSTRIKEGLNIVVSELNSNNDQIAAIVTHGGVIMQILSEYCGGKFFDYLVGNGRGYFIKLYPETMKIDILDKL